MPVLLSLPLRNYLPLTFRTVYRTILSATADYYTLVLTIEILYKTVRLFSIRYATIVMLRWMICLLLPLR
jgi:hypothetical protein